MHHRRKLTRGQNPATRCVDVKTDQRAIQGTSHKMRAVTRGGKCGDIVHPLNLCARTFNWAGVVDTNDPNTLCTPRKEQLTRAVHRERRDSAGGRG